MIPRRVELTNFLSFGERQCIEFSDDEPVWVLCGANGVGKSAVFDAITFALFGQHRGGNQNADQLIRHGANSFLVSVEFEFDRWVYHVERGRDRRAPVARARRAVGAGWQDVDLSPFPARDRIRGWAEQTLGLQFEAFIASVMLRQGDADRIITAQPRDRLNFLRQVIGAERYERLHGRAHSAARGLRGRLDALTADRDRVPEVTSAQLEEAAGALHRAADRSAAARAERESAVIRVEHARQWNILGAEREGLVRRLRDADTRSAERDRIRADHQRFEELARALPAAREALTLRDRLAALDADIAQVTNELAGATAARDDAAGANEAERQRATDCANRAQSARRESARLREQIGRDRRALALAGEVMELARQLGAFPPGLDGLLSSAEQAVCASSGSHRSAGERRATAVALLRAAEDRRGAFDAVVVGANCSRCGQPVTEDHANRERAELDREIQCRRAERAASIAEEAEAAAALAAATAARAALGESARERDRVRDRLGALRGALDLQGVCADSGALQATIAAHTQQAEAHDRVAVAADTEGATAESTAAQHGAAHRRAVERVNDLTNRHVGATTERARAGGRQAALLDQLSAAWRERLAALTPADLDSEQSDLDRLRAGAIEDRFRQLAEDSARRSEWESRLVELVATLNQIPDEARCPVTVAEEQLRTTGEQLGLAEADHLGARTAEAQLREHADRRRALEEEHRSADLEHRLHAELADLLGPQRLQRDLVRSAEREIVRLADATVRSLSRGDLMLELDDEEDGPDRALALRARRAENPSATVGVAYLSGSQKFRVAVAVALAIGRFASGQARPLEAVIIDEGFGSLDRDGLQAMGDELRNLQQTQSLRRLILVSHQEEFVSRFPVGYRLEVGDSGTTAVRFRRECGAEV